MKRRESKAEWIKRIADDASDAMRLAEKWAFIVDQLWDREETAYTFYDRSVLRVSGPTFETDKRRR